LKQEKGERILIEEGAISALSSMLDILKSEGTFIRINASKLSTWIIHFFFLESFTKEKERIMREHFNAKEYLKNLACNIQSSDEAGEILAEALNQIQRGKAKSSYVKKTKKKVEQKDRLEKFPDNA